MRMILLLLLLSACAGEPSACRPEVAAVVPVRLVGNVPVVPAEINGRFAVLVLDTGSDVTVLNRTAALRLGVAAGSPGRAVRGAGGAATVAETRIGRLALGTGIAAENVRALLADAPAPPLDGLLGLDVMVGYELDLDVPHARATFYRVRPCATALPVWEGGTVALPTQMQAGSGHLFVPVTVDGERLRGLLDTGASRSALSVQAAEDLGVDQTKLRALPGSRGQAVNAEGVLVRTRQFRSLQVGTDVLDAPVLSILDLPPFAGDVLVGSDYLARRRVWFSFLLGRVFLQDAAEGAAPGR